MGMVWGYYYRRASFNAPPTHSHQGLCARADNIAMKIELVFELIKKIVNSECESSTVRDKYVAGLKLKVLYANVCKATWFPLFTLKNN